MFKNSGTTPFMAMFIIVLLSLILLLVVGISIGWMLTLILPFTLFEGSILAIIATAFAIRLWFSLFNELNIDEIYAQYERNTALLDDDGEYDEIPAERFYKTPDEQTGEAVFRYQIANGIYTAFQDAPDSVSSMRPSQMKKLAIQLTDLVMALCKRKPSHTKTFRITKAALKKEMTKMELRPYDDDILNAAVKATNIELLDETIDDIVRQKLWDIFFTTE